MSNGHTGLLDFKSGVGLEIPKVTKVKGRLKKFSRLIAKFVNKMTEVHGNRTPLGGC